MSGFLGDERIRLISFLFRPIGYVTTQEEIFRDSIYDVHTFNLSQTGVALLSLESLGRINPRFY